MLKTTKLSLVYLIMLPFLLIAQVQRNDLSSSKTLSPYFYIESSSGATDNFPLKSTKVNVEIDGVIANVSVRQFYTNNGSDVINAKYIFPASTRAAVHGMTMRIGEKVIYAKVKEKELARQEFESAKREGKSASLLEQQRPNVFSMDVSNILPGDNIEIELQYSELLVPSNGTYKFVYPTVVGPRYSNKPDTGSDTWVNTPYFKKNSQKNTISEFDIGVSLYSPVAVNAIASATHSISKQTVNDRNIIISLNQDGTFAGNRDFILSYELTGKAISSGILLSEKNDEKYFLLMVQPPEQIAPADIVPREYIFVVDVSGSMNGFPIETSKELMKKLFSSLHNFDKFNVILFAGQSSQAFQKSEPASSENIKKAIALLDEQQGGGGTELAPALRLAMRNNSEGYSRSIVIITDGYIDAEKEMFSIIRNGLSDANVFAFGIGSSVNRYLIEGIAAAGKGEPFIVTDPGKASLEVSKFEQYIKAPVMTDIKLNFGTFDVYDIEPQNQPDLFSSKPLIVFGKYRGKAQGTIRITGKTGNKTGWVSKIDIAESEIRKENETLPLLWARTRIAMLSDFNFEYLDENDRKEAIINLGLKYNLLSEFTSFIAVCEFKRTSESAKNVNQPLPLPQNVNELAIGENNVRSTPEPSFYILGLLTIAIICLFSMMRRECKNN